MHTKMDDPLTKFELKMLVLIINYKDLKKAESVLDAHKIPIQQLCKGEGTASNEIINYLGLNNSEKAIIFSVVSSHLVKDLFISLSQSMGLNKSGKGIAFTFPISGANSFITKFLTIPNIEKGENQMESQFTHSLLMVTLNQGFSEDAIAAAKTAGASGGTVLHSRLLDSEVTVKKWGVCVLPEKEIILILIKRENKLEVMKAIGKKCGFQSEAQGIIISIPVDAVLGIENT
ncbi:MAG: hypothetical protein ACRCU3_06850 [Eubacteriaceae bacterium]